MVLRTTEGDREKTEDKKGMRKMGFEVKGCVHTHQNKYNLTKNDLYTFLLGD